MGVTHPHQDRSAISHQVEAYRQLENANEIAYQFVNQGLQVEVQRMN
ncbi:MAG: hypothetical protein F6K09_25170 [Merismopedia sp. SIO2A8]|nr:hypothetical protein [Merismopedia sp. SIO2A8]